MTETAKTHPGIEEDIIRAAADNIERLPMLERIFERLSQGLAGSVRVYSGVQVETSVQAIEYGTVGEMIGQADETWLTAVCEADQWNGQFLVLLEPKLLFSLLEILLGGRAASPGEWKPKSFTSIEKRVAQQITEKILGEFETAFAPIDKVRLSLSQFEKNAQIAMVAPPAARATLAKLSIELETRGGAATIIVPHRAVQHIREQLTELSTGESIGQDDEWRTDMQTALSETHVTLAAVLRQMQVPLGEMLSWQPGHVLELGVSPEDEISLCTNSRLVARGLMGRRRNGAAAVRITNVNMK